MTTNLNILQASITTLTIDGLTITRDMAQQLDELRIQDWEKFEPIGRVRTGIKRFGESDPLELIGRQKETGALVRMWLEEDDRRIALPTEDGRIVFRKPAPVTPEDYLRETLTYEYLKLPLLVLPKAAPYPSSAPAPTVAEGNPGCA
ncbi:hypothetical protein [Pseudarthrobacter sp. LMD1-1-1.1]|uniref:hypothetical protein n=1 Tax=Pseudarthrobacter sp. LMD1-1-1.1 TaxID=3135242 RepID=UPI00341C46ED